MIPLQHNRCLRRLRPKYQVIVYGFGLGTIARLVPQTDAMRIHRKHISDGGANTHTISWQMVRQCVNDLRYTATNTVVAVQEGMSHVLQHFSGRHGAHSCHVSCHYRGKHRVQEFVDK